MPYGGSDPARPYYLHKGSKAVLEGKALCQQLDAWAAYGTIERSAAESIKALALSGTLDGRVWPAGAPSAPDGPSAALLSAMAAHGYKAPPGWEGYRELTEK